MERQQLTRIRIADRMTKAAESARLRLYEGHGADACKAVTLSASAKDNDGSVKKVDFYVGTTLVGSATASPYQVNAEGLAAGTHSAVAVVTDNSGLTWMSEYVTFTVEGTVEPESSSSEVAESSSSVESSSSAEPESSSSEVVESSSGTTAIAQRMNLGVEAETAFYRIFDLQGRPLFSGNQKPAKMSAAHVMVVEYTKSGAIKHRYIQ